MSAPRTLAAAALLSLGLSTMLTGSASAAEQSIANFTHAGVPVYADFPDGFSCLLSGNCSSDPTDTDQNPVYRNADTIGVISVSCTTGSFSKIRYATDVPMMWAPSDSISLRNDPPRECNVFDS